MEHSLTFFSSLTAPMGDPVLILILMEHSLTRTFKIIDVNQLYVLILILMEHSLTRKESRRKSAKTSLNPYSNGTLSDCL